MGDGAALRPRPRRDRRERVLAAPKPRRRGSRGRVQGGAAVSASPPSTPPPLNARTPGQRRVSDPVVGGPRGGSGDRADGSGALRGPFGPMLLSPPIGDALQALGAAL